jgi:hypothetical protein
MASISLGSMKRELCGGQFVMTLAIDGKAFFSFIGWMNNTRPDMISLNTYGSADMLELAKGLAGLKMNRSYRISRFLPTAIEGDFRRQQATARAMITQPVETKESYLLNLQDFSEYHARRAMGNRNCAMELISSGREGWHVEKDIADYRAVALKEQMRAADAFMKIAGVRGLFDTPGMDDAHAVECEPSRIDPAPVATLFSVRRCDTCGAMLDGTEGAHVCIDTYKASYREKAFNAYGRYAIYCARASVTPYAFPEWFADCYMGHESDPAANWN